MEVRRNDGSPEKSAGWRIGGYSDWSPIKSMRSFQPLDQLGLLLGQRRGDDHA
jgi:hypothetical protein